MDVENGLFFNIYTDQVHNPGEIGTNVKLKKLYVPFGPIQLDPAHVSLIMIGVV